MKECVIEMYIDAENVPHGEIYRIISYVKERYGENIRMHIYKLEKDKRTKKWDNVIHKLCRDENLKNVEIFEHNLKGKPKKNKVDKQIIAELEKKRHSHKLFILVSSDGDYSEIVRKLRNSHNCICVIGGENAASKLKDAADEFIDYQYLKGQELIKKEKWEKAEKNRQNLETGVQLCIIKLIDNTWMELQMLEKTVEKVVETEFLPQLKEKYNKMIFQQSFNKICNIEEKDGKVIRKLKKA